MSNYNYNEIESRWQQYWDKNKMFCANESSGKPPFYILDMFPYPSGSGLHVGHPLGYIASDIYSRYKRHKGFEVLHPMGFDAFGLPAEQYAIEKNEHPSVTTRQNIDRYKSQLKLIGLSFDWDREVWTSKPDFYKWTQWIFLQLFDSWYDKSENKARPIKDIEEFFSINGNLDILAASSDVAVFTADEWNHMKRHEQLQTLLNYRLAYLSDTEVNWCPELGTVLANDEVKDGYSERGGHPVFKKKMKQWFLRVTAYAERLLNDLESLEWSDALKEMQKNWIGKSKGAEINFSVHNSEEFIKVFTTRPDTIFGSTYMVVAPEHPIVNKITTSECKNQVNEYVLSTKRKTERERISDVKSISGVFTGGYAVHPITHSKLEVWIADYVLPDYGTGAIMAVPAHDSRDHEFALKYKLPVLKVVEGKNSNEGSYNDKKGIIINSDFLNGLSVEDAIKKITKYFEGKGLGKQQINYKLRDAGFSRQRYWGEPFPIVYENDLPLALSEDELPVELPQLDSFKPTGTAESPLSVATDWLMHPSGNKRETDTMPGYAGSSWYYLRFMDPHNNSCFLSKDKEQYWKNVDFYVGGAEHASGHLIYARFWHKFLYDKELVSTIEPFKKLVNQGMIQGRTNFVYRKKGTNTFISKGLTEQHDVSKLRVDVNFVKNDVLDLNAFKNWRQEFYDAEFILEKGKYYCGWEIEKMSKSRYNVVNPDEIINDYGADTFRLYEMFLGPVEISKPWNLNGIEGVFKFLNKFWKLYFDENGQFFMDNSSANSMELKVLHKTIKKVNSDILRFAFNTCVSSFMVCVNELITLKSNKKAILEPLIILISPFAPHLAEELWEKAGNKNSITFEPYPQHEESILKEDEFEYPVSVNGKLRAKIVLPLNMSKENIIDEVTKLPEIQKWTNDNNIKKVIIVPNKIVNIVV